MKRWAGYAGAGSALAEPARSWRSAVALTVAAVYVPQLLPLAVTDILGHAPCLGIYLRHVPILVGFAPGLGVYSAVEFSEAVQVAAFYTVATSATLGVLAITAASLRRWRRAGPVVAIGVALASAALAMAGVAIVRA